MINTIKRGLKPLVLFLVLLITVSTAFAQTGKSDTVSTADVQFTNIPTAQDSIKAFHKKQDSIAKAKKDSTAKAVNPASTKSNEPPKTLWQEFITGFLSGLLALVMPCLYPLLPLTVSFFTKLGGSRSKAIGLSLVYGLSIILIYVSLGLALSIFFGPDTMNAIATSGAFNLIVFVLLVVFAISFLGAFEFTLPSAWANKLDARSDKGGLAGIFFMALTLVVVSFSCTGGVVAGDLASAFSKGERVAPAVSMLGFSSALAIPFTFFALFPSALKSLPKSGGWLNSVKVILGFLELALALKFLSNVDLAYHWNWFDREVFLSLWIAIGLLMTIYLLGLIKFSHDSPLAHLSVTRAMIAMVTLSFVIYMIPGLWGAPLKAISAYLPPPATQDFDLSRTQLSTASATTSTATSIKTRKYEAVFKRGVIEGLYSWYDIDQALQASRELKKPILIDFTGWNCTNCRKMENDVWTNPNVFKMMRDDFVLLQLYVDDKTELDPADQFVSTYSGKHITTIGGKYSDYEAQKFNVNSQPYYIIMDADQHVLVPPQGADYHVNNYIHFLQSGLDAYKKGK